MHLSDNESRHMRIKNFTKQGLGMNSYQSVLSKTLHPNEYEMSYRGAAGKVFSAPMPTLMLSPG
jgi:hypothetical protein